MGPWECSIPIGLISFAEFPLETRLIILGRAPSFLLSCQTSPLMGVEFGVPLSEIATSNTHGEDSPYFAGWKAYDEDPYDAIGNPSGVIQMGLAENQVSSMAILREKIKNSIN